MREEIMTLPSGSGSSNKDMGKFSAMRKTRRKPSLCCESKTTCVQMIFKQWKRWVHHGREYGQKRVEDMGPIQGITTFTTESEEEQRGKRKPREGVSPRVENFQEGK